MSDYVYVKGDDIVVNQSFVTSSNPDYGYGTDEINFFINSTRASGVENPSISSGVVGDLTVPYGCTIDRVTMNVEPSGSIMVDIWKSSYADAPPTDADSITGVSVPAIASGFKFQDNTLTGWTTGITGGDVLRYNVDSSENVENCTISLRVNRL